MSERVWYFIIALVATIGTVVTLKRGWFRYPFLQTSRTDHAPLYWFAVVGGALMALAMFAATLFSN